MKRFLFSCLISFNLLAMQQDIDPIQMGRSTEPNYTLDQVEQVVNKNVQIIDTHLAKPITAAVTPQDADELAQAGVAIAAARTYLQAPFTALTQRPQRSLNSENPEKYSRLLELTLSRFREIAAIKHPGYSKAKSKVTVANLQGAFRNSNATMTCIVM